MLTHELSQYSYLSSSLIPILHGFSDRSLDAKNKPQVRDFFSKLGADSTIMLEQVHGTSCFEVPEEIVTPEPFPQADALVCHRKSHKPRALIIKTADCVPVILYTNSAVAIIHAGWRGLAAGIIEKVLAKHFIAKEVVAAVGPCAREGYEVGQEVINAIGETEAVYSVSTKASFYLDTQETAIRKLMSQGVKQIDSSQVCTIKDSRYFSHRRGDTGRNLSFVVL